MHTINEKSSRINFKYESKNSTVISKANELESALLSWKAYTRNRKRPFAHAFNVILTAVEVFNGYEPDNWLRIVTDNNVFSGEKKRDKEFTSELKEAIKFLIQFKYLEKLSGVRPLKQKTKNYRKPKWLPFAYVITDKWRNEIFHKPQSSDNEIIRNTDSSYVILRKREWFTRKDGKRQPHSKYIPISSDHRSTHQELFKRTEEVIKSHDQMLHETAISLGTKPVRAAQGQLRRIFSRNSFEQGGRLYCPLQNLSAETRKYLRLNDEPIIEIDYSGLHPSMIYMMATGKQFNADNAYEIDGFSREDAKTAFNILINTETTKEKSYNTVKENLGIPYEQSQLLVDGLYEKNAVIASYFNQSYGLKLQYVDSEITLTIIDHFINVLRRPIIPIHDSFIVSVRDTEDLKLIMMDAYRCVGEKELHPEAFLNGIKSTSLQFSEALTTTINKCFEGDTEDMSTEYWDALLSKEPIQECLEVSSEYREDVDA